MKERKRQKQGEKKKEQKKLIENRNEFMMKMEE